MTKMTETEAAEAQDTPGIAVSGWSVANSDYPKCPDCGEERHNPRTGFCWLSKSRNPRSGFHCKHCCKASEQLRQRLDSGLEKK